MARGNVERHTRTGRKGRARQVAATMRELTITRQAITAGTDPQVQEQLNAHAEQLAAEVAGLATGMHTRGHSRRAMLEQMAARTTEAAPSNQIPVPQRVGNLAIMNVSAEVA